LTVRGRIGIHQQIVIFPDFADQLPPQLLSSLASRGSLDSQLLNGDLSDLLRYGAGVEDISIRYEPVAKRFTVILPKELARLGLISEIGSSYVLLAIGDSLELWRSANWNIYRSLIAGKIPQLISEMDNIDE
jgi:hypothetical protein